MGTNNTHDQYNWYNSLGLSLLVGVVVRAMPKDVFSGAHTRVFRAGDDDTLHILCPGRHSNKRIFLSNHSQPHDSSPLIHSVYGSRIT